MSASTDLDHAHAAVVRSDIVFCAAVAVAAGIGMIIDFAWPAQVWAYHAGVFAGAVFGAAVAIISFTRRHRA